MPGRQSTLIKLEFLPLLCNWAQPLAQGGGVGIKVDEDKVAEAFAAYRLQPSGGKIQIREVLRIANSQQLALAAVRPAVIRAGKALLLPGFFGDNRCATVTAGIVKCVNDTVV